MEGWICLHRKLREWEWYSDRNTCAVFFELLLTANFKPSRYMGIDIPIGSTVTGRETLAKTLGLSEQNVRTALIHLKSTNELTIKNYSKFSVISIVNWIKYQDTNQQSNQHLTSMDKLLQPKGEFSYGEPHKTDDVLLSHENQPTEDGGLLNIKHELNKGCKNNQPASNQHLTTLKQSNKVTKEVSIEALALTSSPENTKDLKLKRGSRLPDGWELEQEDGDWAIQQGLTEDQIIIEAEKFKDYWHSRADKGAIKKDWIAVWRNWVRSTIERKNNEIQKKKFK